MARSISTTASVARPTHLLNSTAKATAAAKSKSTSKTNGARKRQSKTAVVQETAGESADYSTAATPHRPTTAGPVRTIPLMQCFRTSGNQPAKLSTAASTRMDHTYLPNLFAEDRAYDPYAHIRVPLLPDNATPPPVGMRLPEATDLPLTRPEIRVVAANPELVLPAALTEVEGMGVDGVELKFVHDMESKTRQRDDMPGGGMIRDLWKGLVDDVLGAGSHHSGNKPAGA